MKTNRAICFRCYYHGYETYPPKTNEKSLCMHKFFEKIDFVRDIRIHPTCEEINKDGDCEYFEVQELFICRNCGSQWYKDKEQELPLCKHCLEILKDLPEEIESKKKKLKFLKQIEKEYGKN